MVKLDGNTVVTSGWAHFECGPWEARLKLPHGYDLVEDKKDVAQEGDMCMVAIKELPKRKPRATPYQAKAKFVYVVAGNYGIAVSLFNAVIRRKPEQ